MIVHGVERVMLILAQVRNAHGLKFCSYYRLHDSGTHEKTAKLEGDLAALRVALSEAKRELRQREKDSQVR